MTSPKDSKFQPSAHEAEHQGSIWKHPYMIYIMLTAALFGFLVFMAYLAIKNGWIPNRGI
jgi:hypothetical protein